jgi:hypothetical protein
MDRWMNEKIGGWIDGWMDGLRAYRWMDVYQPLFPPSSSTTNYCRELFYDTIRSEAFDAARADVTR